jgi:hypothetical protein
MRLSPFAPEPAVAAKLRHDAGLSLVEIMLAMTILTVVMVMLFGTMLSSQALSRVNKSALMEQISILPIANIGATFPNATDIPEFTDLHVANQRVRVVYANNNPDARPLQFQVISTWTTVGGLPARLVVQGLRAR